MSWWLFERVRRKAEKLKDHVKCNRCGQYFHTDHERCNHCSNISDAELSGMLEKRRAFRMTLGRYMFIGAALILLVMVALASK